MALHPEIKRVALLGWRIYPASVRTRAACFAGAADVATSDPDQLHRWAREFPGCNWRVVPEGSGIWGLDLDVAGPDHAANGISAFADLMKENGPIPPRPMTRSGGGGLCLFFSHNDEAITGRTGCPAPGIDPRRGRLSITLPPSRHHRTGRPYTWISPPPWVVAPPPAPAWLLRLVAPPPPRPMPERPPLEAGSERERRYAVAALRNAVHRVATARPGTRNHELNTQTYGLARFIGSGALAPAEIADSLAHAGLAAGLGRQEIEATLKSGLAAGVRR